MADLTDIVSRLLAEQFDFVIIGGLAAVTHGSPVMTHDIDVCCDFSPNNQVKFIVSRPLGGVNPAQLRIAQRRRPEG